MKVRKAVIAAAGFGTRFLPQTKAMPKEMLPILDKPIIQYIVEDLVDAGIEDIIIVTGYHKRSIEDHFDQISGDLRANLEQGGKTELLESTQAIANLANFIYIRQKGPYGNGTPVLNAEHIVGDEPFIYTFADDYFRSRPTQFRQIVSVYEQYGTSVLPCMRFDADADFERYGFVAGDEKADGLISMKDIVEKPGRAAAPSNLGSVKGYLFTPDIFGYLRQSLDELEEGKEFLIHAGMHKMIQDGKELLAYEMKDADYFDTGNVLEYLKTVVSFAIEDPEIAKEFKSYISSVLDK
jgi:UTP--glucose-1-phosphate uridylyltransferase